MCDRGRDKEDWRCGKWKKGRCERENRGIRKEHTHRVQSQKMKDFPTTKPMQVSLKEKEKNCP